MEHFVRLTAPNNKIDFVIKLLVLLLIGGAFNHLRDVMSDGFADADTFLNNSIKASFTALPMCAFALMLISHLNALQERLYVQAMHDSLTGLPNRRWFMENTPEQLGPDQALMIIDIDYFKRINDTYGHDVGDDALKRMGEHLEEFQGDFARCARIGGEEFAVFFKKTDTIGLRNIAEKFSSGFMFDAEAGERKQITTSVGIALGQFGLSRSTAIKLADEAVYQAKARGRARFEIGCNEY